MSSVCLHQVSWCMAGAQHGRTGLSTRPAARTHGQQGAHHGNTALPSTRAGQHPDAARARNEASSHNFLLCPPQGQGSLLEATFSWAENWIKNPI
ncbi:uncharacterized protein DS421_5g153390 [Arachis hypogaea]|nr:uncharacterized protein DS421_5g153390 [Arachis hypogaea]